MEGSRPLHKEIWTANVPPEVHIFAWKLWQDGLATQENRRRHRLVGLAAAARASRSRGMYQSESIAT
jgi:hypothetical protein